MTKNNRILYSVTPDPQIFELVMGSRSGQLQIVEARAGFLTHGPSTRVSHQLLCHLVGNQDVHGDAVELPSGIVPLCHTALRGNLDADSWAGPVDRDGDPICELPARSHHENTSIKS